MFNNKVYRLEGKSPYQKKIVLKFDARFKTQCGRLKKQQQRIKNESMNQVCVSTGVQYIASVARWKFYELYFWAQGIQSSIKLFQLYCQSSDYNRRISQVFVIEISLCLFGYSTYPARHSGDLYSYLYLCAWTKKMHMSSAY